ncbi:DUF637 domain-containing protein [Burkholderia gladioli]|nr:DUF637 domain-containing protein [Burkholderia gladioli]
MFSKDKRHDIWACGTPEQCQALYGSAYTSTGGQIDPPTPVGNIAATIQAPNLSIVSNGQIQNVGNVIGTSVSLSGQKLINGITQPNVYTPSVSAPQRVITLSPSTLPGLNLSIPRTVGTGTLPTPVPGKAVYVDDSLGSSAIGSLGAQDLLDNLPASLKSGPAVFYYNPQEENLLLQQAALQQTGKASFVDGLSYDSTSGVSVVEQEKAYLYQNAIDYAKQNDLQLGQALTQSQVDQLDRPMLWYVEQTFPDPACTATGTGQCPMITALMPQVYLPKDVGAMSAGGNIVGKDVTLSFNQDGHGSVLNTGSITASGTLSVDTQTLTNQANQVNVGEIWQKVDGGYVKTTGTTVQPGGFMSAANMDLNVEALNQIGGALKQLNPDGTVDAAGTQALLASLQQQLGGNFTQQTLTDQLHTDFVKEGGAFGMDQLGMLVMAVVASIVTYGAASTAIGSLATTGSTFAAAGSASAGLGNVVLSSAIAGIASSAAGQLVGTGKLNLGSAFEAGAIAAITAGLMNGITYSAESGLGFTTQPVTAGAGTQTLANLAGVKPVVGTVTNQATTAVTVDLGTRGLAMLAGGVIDAGVGTAIRGGSFLDALKGSLVSEVSAAGANAIGDAGSVSGSLVEAGTPGYWHAHAALGCASSAAMGTGCAGGAIGGAISAGLNPIIDANGNIPPAMLAGIETLVGGGAAAALGFNAQGAATAAQNETLNNWLNHVTVLPGQKSEAQQATEARAGCESGNAAACASAATLMQKSSLRDQALATACQSPGSVACAYQKSLAYLTGNTIQSEGGTTVAVETPQPTFTAPSPAAATLDNMLGSPLAGILGGLMYASGASPVDAYYASVIGQAAEGIAAGAAGLKMPSAPTNGSLASTSRATNTPSALQQVTDLFSSNARGSIQIDGSTFKTLPNAGNAAMFAGASDAQVQQYFLELSGASFLPNPVPLIIRGVEGVRDTVGTPSGNFTQRSVSPSQSQTGPAWTIEVPSEAIGMSSNKEIKFLRGTSQ